MIKIIKQIFIIILVLLAPFLTRAQSSIVDSLKLELNKYQGEQRVPLLLSIADEISSIELSSSIKYANEALKLSEIGHHIIYQADCRVHLGKYFFEQGKYEKAHICFKKALKYYQAEEYSKAFSETYLHIGHIYSREGLLDSAYSYYQMALLSARQNQDTLWEISSLRAKGNVYYKKGQFDEALKIFQEGLVIAYHSKSNKQGLANIYNNLGILFSDWGKYEKSLQYYKEALAIQDSLGNFNEQARLFNNIGTIYWYQGKSDSALIFYIRSLNEREELGDINGKAYVLNNLGMYYGNLEDYEKSLEYFNKSLHAFEIMSNRHGIVMSLYNIGSVYQAEEKYQISLKYFNQSLQVAKEYGFYDYIVANHEAFKDVYAAMGKWEKAYQSLSTYKRIKDSIREIQNIELISEMEVKFEKERNHAEIQIIENQMQASKIIKTKTLILITGIIIILILVLISTYLLVRQNKIRTETKRSKLNPALLRYQLNPQFINSSLSGIKELIAKTRIKESSIFLSGLAKLIRVFVETSTVNAIVLDKELETLQSFLKLHQMRYDYDLKFELDIEPHVETEMLAIPPFLFFPIYVHIIDNHLSRGVIHTFINISTLNNYLIMETKFTYYVDYTTKDFDQDEMDKKIFMVTERVHLLNETLKDKMQFTSETKIENVNLLKTVLLSLKLPIKPM